jgi:GntR family transcriptional repressor for pyruvate dehydrogenase complex
MDNLVRLDPIDSTPGYHRVAQTIESEIVSGRLLPGDPLPTEIELANQLGVHRSTVREGIRALENAGLIRRAGAKRLVIAVPEQQEVTWTVCRALGLAKLTFPEFWEILMSLEPAAARLAAGHALPDVLAALRENLRLTEEQLYNDDALIGLDVEFHCLVAKATRNRAVMMSEEPVAMLLHSATELLYQRSPRARFRLLEAHRHVVDAIAAGDGELAERWMRKHIQDFRRGYIVAGMDFKGPIKFNARCRPAKL